MDGWYGTMTPLVRKFKLMFTDVDGTIRLSNCISRENTPRGQMYVVHGKKGYTVIGEKDVIKKIER